MRRLLQIAFVALVLVSTHAQTTKILGVKASSGPGIAFVKSATNGAGCDGASSTTVAATFGSNVAAGSAVVVVYSADSAGAATRCSTATVADGTNTYTVAASQNNSSNDQCTGIAYAYNVTGGAAYTVTVTFGASTFARSIAALEYSGVKTTSPSDGANNAYTAGTSTWLSGSVTTTAAGDLVVGGVEVSGSTSTAHAPGSGFTERVDLWTCRFAVVDQVQTSAGAIEASGTLTGGAGNCTGVALALKKQ